MREEVYAALFALLDPLVVDGTLNTTSRRLQFAEDVDPGLLPGVWQNQFMETPAKFANSGAVCWYFDVDWYIYFLHNDETTPSTPSINAVVDKVMGVLPRDESGTITVLRVTLPDDPQPMVVGLSIREPVRTWEGLLNNKAVVEIPLRLLVPTP